MSHLKKQLLEYLIRECVCEVIEQDAKATIPPNPEPKPTPPVTPPTSDLTLLDDPDKTAKMPQAFGDRGIYLVDPRNKSRLKRVTLEFSDDYTLERNLYNIVAPFAGHRVSVELGTLRILKSAIRNRNITVYLYLANKEGRKVLKHGSSLRDAQKNSMTAGSLFSKILPPGRIFEPITATSQRRASQIGTDVNEETVGAPAPPADGLGTGQQPPIPYDKKKIEDLKEVIKKLIREVFSK
jgi:hypothetical protein